MFLKGTAQLTGNPSVGRHAVILHELEVMRCRMIGCKEHCVISFSHLAVEHREEICKTLVKSEISIFRLHCVRSELMTYIVGR